MNKPLQITELVSKLEFYIDEIRNQEKEESLRSLELLESYAKESISALSQGDPHNKDLIISLTNSLYREFVKLEIVDIYTNGYIAIVLNRLFWELGLKDCRIFYILDNTLRDDRFKSILQQLPPAGFSLITPHIADTLTYESVTTVTKSLPYEDIEAQITEAIRYKKNIMYIERDTSVNYLEKVITLARSAPSDYVAVLRNSAPENPNVIRIDDISHITFR